MSLVSDTRLRSYSNNDDDRMEKAEAEDAEAEERAEHSRSAERFDDVDDSDDSLKRIPQNICFRISSHLKKFLRLNGHRFSNFWFDVCNKFIGFFKISGISFINHRSIRSEAALSRERVRQESTFPFIIHPFSLFRWLWEIGIILACLIFLVLEPIRTTFYPVQHLKRPHEWTKPLQYHAVLFFDVMLNLRTGLVRPTTNIVTLDWRKVVANYLSGWFIIDLFSSVPMNAIYMGLVHYGHLRIENNTPYNCFRFLSLIKLLLLFRLIRYLKRIEKGLRLNGLEIRLVNLVLVMILFMHWFACAHYIVPEMKNQYRSGKSESSWLTRRNASSLGVYDIYVLCFLRALSHMSPVGPGFDSPIEREEIYVTIANIVVGMIFIAQFLGYVIIILMSLDVSERKFIEVTKQVGEYMKFNQIPRGLQRRVEDYFDQRYRRSYFSENLILENISNALRKELLMHNCQTLVEEVPLFHSVNRTIIQDIVTRLEFEFYLPNDVIIHANTVGDCMYFIEHGLVSILAPDGQTVCTLQDGDFFGEMSLVFREPRAATVLANSYCGIYRLRKVDFAEIIQPYPEIYESILKVAEARAIRLDKSQLYKHADSMQK